MKRLELPGQGRFGGLSTSSNGCVFITRENIIISMDRHLKASIFAGNVEERGFQLGNVSKSLFTSLLGIFASSSELYVYEDDHSYVLRICDGLVEKYAGCGEKGFQDGPRAVARFSSVSSITMTSNGLIFLADTLNNLVRIIHTNGLVTSIGSGCEKDVDGEFPFHCSFASPFGLSTAIDDSVLVSCVTGNSVRYISWNEKFVTTYCESESCRYLLGNGKMGIAPCTRPLGIVCSSTGDLYVAESTSHSVSAVDCNGLPSFIGAQVPDIRFLTLTFDGKFLLCASDGEIFQFEINKEPPHLVSFQSSNPSFPSSSASSETSLHPVTLQSPNHPFSCFDALLSLKKHSMNTHQIEGTTYIATLPVTNSSSQRCFFIHKEILLLQGEEVLAGTIRFIEQTTVSEDIIIQALTYLYGSETVLRETLESVLKPFMDMSIIEPMMKLAEALQMMSGQLNVPLIAPGSSRRSVPSPIVHPTFKLIIEGDDEEEKVVLYAHDWMVAVHFPALFSSTFTTGPNESVLPYGFPSNLLIALIDFFYTGILSDAFDDPFNVIYVLVNQNRLGFSQSDGVPSSRGFAHLLEHCTRIVERPLTTETAVLILKYRIETNHADIESARLYVARNAVPIFRIPGNQLLFRSLPGHIINSVVRETIQWHEEDKAILNFAMDHPE